MIQEPKSPVAYVLMNTSQNRQVRWENPLFSHLAICYCYLYKYPDSSLNHEDLIGHVHGDLLHNILLTQRWTQLSKMHHF